MSDQPRRTPSLGVPTVTGGRDVVPGDLTLPQWTVCQIGSREHYSIPQSFAEQGRLDALLTDIWVPPNSFAGRLAGFAGGAGRAFQGRYLEGLSNQRVLTLGASALTREILCRISSRRSWSWDAIHQANERMGIAFAQVLRGSRVLEKPGQRAVFAYSYGALEVLREAKGKGAVAILGQIDPGPGEAQYVEGIACNHGLAVEGAQVPGPNYWARWREECAVADKIVVNSRWSRELLLKEGIPTAKIAVVPLAVAPFNLIEAALAPLNEGRLKLLFLGQVSVRKGIVELIEALRELDSDHIHLSIVGPVEERLKRFLASGLPRNISFHGRIPRSDAIKYYRQADVFVFPTHSDGFGLTQLEAMAAGLPVLASRNCGSVVRDAVDGRLLDSVTPREIAEAIRWFYANRRGLDEMRAKARERASEFTPSHVVPMLDCLAGLNP